MSLAFRLERCALEGNEPCFAIGTHLLEARISIFRAFLRRLYQMCKDVLAKLRNRGKAIPNTSIVRSQFDTCREEISVAAFEFKLPDVGEGIHEGEIVKLLVKEGDKIEEFEPFAEVQTDKAVVEIPSPVTGVVKQLKVAEGEVALVHSTIAVIDIEGDAPVDPHAPAEEEPGAEVVKQEIAKQEAQETAAPAPAAESTEKKRVLAMPSVRKLARELGVDITKVTGSAKHGRITAEDVEKFAADGEETRITEAPKEEEKVAAPAKTEPAAPTAVVAGGQEERIPLKGIRKTISRRMVESRQTSAHITLMDEVDVTELIELRKWGKEQAANRGVKLTYLPFIMKAVVGALRVFPTLNASIDAENEEIVIKKYYHIGMAAATDNGLMVPVLKDADRKSIFDLAGELTDKAVRARDMKLAPDELKGSTFTISSLGNMGGTFFTPIINQPEVAILGVGAIKEKPVVHNGEVAVRSILHLSLSVDHRLIDGDVAARFLTRLKSLLESPNLLMMEM